MKPHWPAYYTPAQKAGSLGVTFYACLVLFFLIMPILVIVPPQMLRRRSRCARGFQPFLAIGGTLRYCG